MLPTVKQMSQAKAVFPVKLRDRLLQEILKIFSKALSDYWGGRKQLAIAGYGLSALITPLFAIASSPTSILVARFGDRFGKGIHSRCPAQRLGCRHDSC
ncbi:hypothetical protein [Microcoleus sp. FACHB-1515]|uniref:hypothetical protein n=1 Tax=Microcoleus sp. FACHB-1515 TaxID=2692821 RepID=UPI0018F05A48|nr:hypothetical protein [Microcoleus sp. FACHB-1515]